jgi:hypothetical protein
MHTCSSRRPKPFASSSTLLLRYLLRLHQQTSNCVLRFVLFLILASCSRVLQTYPIVRLLVQLQPMPCPFFSNASESRKWQRRLRRMLRSKLQTSLNRITTPDTTPIRWKKMFAMPCRYVGPALVYGKGRDRHRTQLVERSVSRL